MSLALTIWHNVNAFPLGSLPFQNIISERALFDEPNQMTATEEDEAARRALTAPAEITADDDDDDDNDGGVPVFPWNIENIPIRLAQRRH